MSIIKNSAMDIFFFVLVTSLIVGCGENEPSSYGMAPAEYATQSEMVDSLFKYNSTWLSATDNSIDTNYHPAPSSICGWVILNYLNESIMIFNSQGNPLGYIDHKGKWRSPPGQPEALVPPDSINTHLRQLVNWIINKVDDESLFMATFSKSLDYGIEKIKNTHGEDIDQSNSLSILINKPLALVRASIKTEVPFQFKDHPKLKDGLVTFWIEDLPNQSYRDNTYYTLYDPQLSNIQFSSSSEIDGQSEVQISMLQLFPGLYKDMLTTMELSFLSAPLLTQNESTNTSLPQEQGYDWTWIEQGEKTWPEQTVAGRLSKKELGIFFPDNVDLLWSKLIKNNSLSLLEGDNALITLSNSTSPLSEIAPDFSPKLEEYLKNRQINHLTKQDLKEGWLNLKKKSVTPNSNNE